MTPAAFTLFLFVQPVQFRISTEAVPVDVFVSKDGKAVAGLAREDFEIYDEGKLQRIDHVSFGTVPVNVMLALDTSTSVAGETLAHLRTAEWSRRTRLLRRLTEESGGRLLETRSPDQLQATFLEILAEMKSRYVLTYSPPFPVHEGWHDIEVRVKRRGAEVHARQGYYYSAKR
jgi:hypothetical protein